jgi:hypothetical protein
MTDAELLRLAARELRACRELLSMASDSVDLAELDRAIARLDPGAPVTLPLAQDRAIVALDAYLDTLRARGLPFGVVEGTLARQVVRALRSTGDARPRVAAAIRAALP